ncbi:MAG: CPBP family intramembrane metalloprotease [Flavobacteriales bacterium]|nr:CPBP family intramembrane metalloprotease [Flavobacteriales bacterium]
MKNKKFLLGLLIFLLGVVGVLSLLTSELPMNALPALVRERFTDAQIKLLVLLNPVALVLIMVCIGTPLHERAGLSVPTLMGWLQGTPIRAVFAQQVKAGVVYGALAGVLLVGISFAFGDTIAADQEKLAAGIKPSLLARFLYGGITEEILIRFGMMTLVLWLALKMLPSTAAAWTSIAVASLVFALGHLPAVFAVITEPSASLYAYILLGNIAGGLVFGWLYWKKGLEAAMIGHAMAHVVMVSAEQLLPG